MLNKKGQNTAEYAIVITLVIGVAIAMQTYVKRGIQARVKDEVVDLATQTSDLGTTQQYEPNYLDSEMTITTAKDDKAQSGTAEAPTISVEFDKTQTGSQTYTYTP